MVVKALRAKKLEELGKKGEATTRRPAEKSEDRGATFEKSGALPPTFAPHLAPPIFFRWRRNDDGKG